MVLKAGLRYNYRAASPPAEASTSTATTAAVEIDGVGI